jgi:hypothetical protein
VCVCKKSGDSVDHLLLHCEMASALWNTVFNLIGLAWVMPSNVVDLFTCWKWHFSRLQNAFMWKMVPSCLMWSPWKERNYQSFEDCERTKVKFKDFFFKTLYHWTASFD